MIEPEAPTTQAEFTINPESTTEPGSPPAGPDPERARLKKAAECVLLVVGGPVTTDQLKDTLGVSSQIAHEVLMDLVEDYRDRGLQIQALAGGFQLCTRPEFSEYVQRFLQLEQREPLSQAALETLAIIAYRQPVTRAEIESVRGVGCTHVLERLLDRHLIRDLGRKRVLGRPILYGTTEGFLRHFGLRDLDALPPLRGNDPRSAFGATHDRDGEDTPV